MTSLRNVAYLIGQFDKNLSQTKMVLVNFNYSL